VKTQDKREVLEGIMEKMEECAELIRSLEDERLERYCLAAFEGRNGGWLGEFERDILQQALEDLDGDEDEENES
jgi:hypothetical protein